MSNYKLLYVTCGSKREANKIGEKLVKNKLAACTNIIDNVKSVFKWNNKIANNKECILVGKTTSRNINKIIKTIENFHSYECPCILFFNIQNGNKKFLKWIKNNSK